MAVKERLYLADYLVENCDGIIKISEFQREK